MEQCIKCNKEFKVKDLFLQWTSYGESYICKDCIEKHKEYAMDPCYSSDSDITFIFAIARVHIADDNYIALSQSLIGYHYGHYSDEDNKKFAERILRAWLTKDKKVRKDLLRQAFNDNCKDNEEVLY